jgi:hypothetical protein
MLELCVVLAYSSSVILVEISISALLLVCLVSSCLWKTHLTSLISLFSMTSLVIPSTLTSQGTNYMGMIRLLTN